MIEAKSNAIKSNLAWDPGRLGLRIKANWKCSNRRSDVDILGISELKWIGMGEFNSDDHYNYYFGQESLRRNGVALIIN